MTVAGIPLCIALFGIDSAAMNLALSARALAQVVPVGRRSREVGTEDAAGSAPVTETGEPPPRRCGDMPVLFLHGWAVGPHSYGAPLGQLRDFGCDVFAPAQPGFGGTPSLEGSDWGFAGYARWAADYLDALGVDRPVTVVGHSFGGGVAIQLAHDQRQRVAAVVLCNAVGGFPWAGPAGPEPIAERPWWEWGRVIGTDLLAAPSAIRVLPALLGEAVPNLVSNPLAMWRVGEFVRKAHLLEEIAALGEAGVPVTLVWSDRDRLVPHAGFTALCRAASVDGEVVPGGHSWLIAEPRRFADIVLRAMVDAGVLDDALATAS
jgi:pimeloyl-ACP methyl ester carboxylesterase